jgi:galactofuranosylgalactofuranosylrhamnosyl-N-acetylglucosaminyl-diphospho-decaprenol beta-1,5/1,6-galactofuranosyltransferase
VTDSAQDAFRVRQFDRQTVNTLMRDGGRLLLRLAREGRAASDTWRAALPQLTSRENWQRLFESAP